MNKFKTTIAAGAIALGLAKDAVAADPDTPRKAEVLQEVQKKTQDSVGGICINNICGEQIIFLEKGNFIFQFAITDEQYKEIKSLANEMRFEWLITNIPVEKIIKLKKQADNL